MIFHVHEMYNIDYISKHWISKLKPIFGNFQADTSPMNFMFPTVSFINC